MRYLVISVLISLVLVGAGCRRAMVVQAPQDVQVTVVEQKEDREALVIDIKKPQSGWPVIDAQIDAFIAEQLQAFEAEISDWPALDVSSKSGFYVTSETVESSRLITFVMYVSPYFAGAAHPNTYIHTLMFEKSRGERVPLPRLLRNGLDDLPLLSEKALIQLKATDISDLTDEEWLNEGTKPTEENLRRVALDDDGLWIYFDPYQVAAYAAGPQKVEIPLDEVPLLIRESYL